MAEIAELTFMVAYIKAAVGIQCSNNKYRSPKKNELNLYNKVRGLLLDGTLQIPDPHSGKVRAVTDKEIKVLNRQNKVKVKTQSSLDTHLMFEISPVQYWRLFTLKFWNKCPHAKLYIEIVEVEAPEPKIEVTYFRNGPKAGGKNQK